MTTPSTPLLESRDLAVSYGRMRALRGVSIRVMPGEIVGVIGPNGAGKSTLLAALAGGVALASGDVALEGRPITNRRPEDRARDGLSLVPEGRHIFASLTVLENLLVASYLRRDRRGAEGDVERVLKHFPRLRERISYPAGRLSGGEQQMLAIGRALMTRPRLLMIDEPSLGLGPKIVEQIYDIVCDLRVKEGLTLLINEQSSIRVLKRCHRVYVLRDGRIQLDGTAEALADGEAIKRAYFGFEGSGNQKE
jgi:branched-chain amino acid transport system ATP-binding protein